jgi:hypothetical protein
MKAWYFIYLFIYLFIYSVVICKFTFFSLFIYSHVYILFGSFLSPAPLHQPLVPPPHFQAEPVLLLSLILLKRSHKHNKEDKQILLVEIRIAIQRDS